MHTFKTLIAGLALLVITQVGAAPITGTISGNVTSVSGSVNGVALGSSVSGSYTYDNASTASNVVGDGNPLTAFSLMIGTNPFVFDFSSFVSGSILNPVRVGSKSTATTDYLVFFLIGSDVNAFLGAGSSSSQTISNQLPESMTLGALDRSVEFAFVATPNAAAVPEPASLALVGIALAAAGVAARRRTL